MSPISFREKLRLILCALCLAIVGCGPSAVPRPQDPGAITVEGALGSPVLLANGDSTVYARIRVGTARLPERERGPVNLALAIDTSGSMEGKAIQEARRASEQLVDALKDGDRLAVVVFHSKAELLLESKELDRDVRETLRQQLRAMEARGTTALASGLDMALDQVRAHFEARGVNRVVLLGDGVPNEPAGIESTARTAANMGIAITTLGLGLDYDETLMGKIADLSGGRYQYIESPDKLAGFFREELQHIDAVYGRRAYALLTPGPGVRIDAVVGVNEPSARSAVQVALGDISRGDSRDILVRMTVTPRKPDVPIELLDTVIHFDDALGTDAHLERRVYLGARTTLDTTAVAKAKNADIELSAALAEAAATTIRAIELSKLGQNSLARTMLTKGVDIALAQAKRTPSAALEKHAANMSSVAKDLPERDSARPAAAESSYDFQDDSLNASPGSAPRPSAPTPAAAQRQKAAHSYAVESTH